VETIITALITATATGVPATLMALSVYKKHGQAMVSIDETKAAIGKPNGHGNVIQMIESVLIRQGQHDAEFTRVNARITSLEQSRIVRTDDRIASLEQTRTDGEAK
jgi:hypothetical protein